MIPAEYDEEYQGWGNEDDDLGIRFYAAGIRGLNPFNKDYVIHFYHTRFHSGERVNRSYYHKRRKEINKSNYRCRYGYEQYGKMEQLIVREIVSRGTI